MQRSIILCAVLAACGGPSRDETPDAEPPTFKPAGLTVLADGEKGPNGIVADEQAAYFVTATTSTTSVIRKVDLQTFAVSTLVPNAFGAVRMAADADNLYYATQEKTQSRIVAVSKATGATRDLATGQENVGLVVVDGDSVYWSSYSGTDTVTATSLRTVHTDGTGVRDLVKYQEEQLYDLGVDSTRVFVAGIYSVYAVDKMTGTSTVLSTQRLPVGKSNLALGADGVYVSNRVDNTISRMSKTDGAMTTLATNQATPGRLAVASDGTVYWAARGAQDLMKTSLGGVLALHPGDATPTTIAMGLDHAIEPTVLTHAVLWTVYGSPPDSIGSVMAAPR